MDKVFCNRCKGYKWNVKNTYGRHLCALSQDNPGNWESPTSNDRYEKCSEKNNMNDCEDFILKKKWYKLGG